MEEMIIALLSGDITVVGLLLLFIIGILTKRFVPWWVYEQVLGDLKAYEQDAPKLIDTVEALIDEVQSQGHAGEKLQAARDQTRSIRKRTEDGRRIRAHRKRGHADENSE